MINNQYVNQKPYKSGLHLLRHSPPDKLLMIALACSLTFQRNAGSNAYMADAERIPCNGLFCTQWRGTPCTACFCLLAYQCMLACWRRLTPIQSSVFAQRFAVRLYVPHVTLQVLALRLVFVPLALRLQL